MAQAKHKSTTKSDTDDLDLAYRRIEGRVNDLDRLSEIAINLTREVLENPQDTRRGDLAVMIVEIMRDRMKEFRSIYYEWYEAPPREGDRDADLAAAVAELQTLDRTIEDFHKSHVGTQTDADDRPEYRAIGALKSSTCSPTLPQRHGAASWPRPALCTSTRCSKMNPAPWPSRSRWRRTSSDSPTNGNSQNRTDLPPTCQGRQLYGWRPRTSRAFGAAWSKDGFRLCTDFA